MSEANDPMADWQALTRQSWQNWADFARRAGAPAASAATAPDAGTASATVERMLAGAQDWLQWMQSAAGTDWSGDDWQASMQRMFAQAGQPFAQAFGGIDGAGAQGFERLMRQWTGAWSDPGAELRGWLGMPAFGFAREQQQQQQQLAAAMLEYADQMKRYHGLIARANQDGIERLQAMLAARAEPGRQLDSLRALYNLWVDAAEEAYAEVALSPEFRQTYGALVNAQMRVRSLQNKQVEQLAAQLGMPTRRETDSLGKRLQELRRQMRGVDIGALADEVAALRAEVEALRAGSVAAKAPAKRARTSASRKTAPRKAASKAAPRKAASKAAPRKVASKAAPRKVASKAAPRKAAARKAAGKRAGGKTPTKR